MTHITIERETLEQVLDDLYAGGYHRSRAIKVLAKALEEPVNDAAMSENWNEIASILKEKGSVEVQLKKPLCSLFESLPVYDTLKLSLTDEQLLDILRGIDSDAVRLPPGFKAFARAIEAAHGITKGQP